MRSKVNSTLGFGLLFSVGMVAQAADITRDDLAVFHGSGVKISWDVNADPELIPVDIDEKRLKQAKLLDFSGVDIGDHPAFLRWLAKFKALKVLNLRNTRISASPEFLALFDQMQDLQRLDLSKNPLFEKEGANAKLSIAWGNLPNLYELNLTNTNGTVSQYGSFAQLTKLTKLNLGENPALCELSVWDFSKFGKACIVRLDLQRLPLEWLELSGDQIKEDPLAYLPHTTLRGLSLDHNQLTALNVPREADFAQLEYWNLAGNPKLVLDDDFGSELRLKSLGCVGRDASAMLPKRLQARQQCSNDPDVAPTQAAQPVPVAPIPKSEPIPADVAVVPKPNVLEPKNVAEIEAWLVSADSVKRNAVWRYLNLNDQHNDAGAAHWLGRAFHKGLNAKPDWTKARRYYLRAEQLGSTAATVSLTNLYTEASYVLEEWAKTKQEPKNGALAKALYSEIAKGNNDKAKKARKWLDYLEANGIF